MALLNEENLPELLRKALQAKREEEEREGIISGIVLAVADASAVAATGAHLAAAAAAAAVPASLLSRCTAACCLGCFGWISASVQTLLHQCWQMLLHAAAVCTDKLPGAVCCCGTCFWLKRSFALQ